MKNILASILLLILFTFIRTSSIGEGHPTEAIVFLPSIPDTEVLDSIIIDLEELDNFFYVDISLASKSIAVKFDSAEISETDIIYIFEKWAITPSLISFRTIFK